MKKFVCILFLSCISGFSEQETVEVVGVNVNFAIQKCTSLAGVIATCDEGGSNSHDIFIPLASCDTHDGIKECYGAWQSTLVRDGHEFYGVIVIDKQTHHGESSYAWTISVGPLVDSADPATTVTLLPRDGNRLSDALHLDGSILWNNDNTGYYACSLHLRPILPVVPPNN